MKLEPIIKIKVSKFKEDHNCVGLTDDQTFEHFVNWIILQRHQPNAFTSDIDLLDSVCVGGQNDMGIDGICISINGMLIKSITEAQDLVKSCPGKLPISFIFIQSKNRVKLEQGEHDQFLNGVKDFVGEKQYQPYNEKIKNWLEIKNFIMSDQCCMKWLSSPSLYIYYVYMGDLENTPHTIAGQNRFIDDVKAMNTYQFPPAIEIVNSEKIKKYCDEIENRLDIQLSILESCSFLGENEHIDGVSENSFVAVCRATEILKLISSEDGLLRKGIFDDNVRDYQGETVINTEILDTIKQNPKNFVLYNNGITIVCDELILRGKSITIHNPQIVNGCQTCNVIFCAAQDGDKNQLAEVKVIVKIISTTNNQIINNVVRGTNRQNIVQDEAFETIRDFHKNLEEFFYSSNIVRQMPLPLYYERRSKQYDNTAIKEISKVRFSPLIRGFISIFLSSPHRCVNHPALLLKEYSGIIFVDKQSYLPYYTSAQLIALFDGLSQKNKLPEEVASYKFHLAYAFALMGAGFLPNINIAKQADAYCEKLLSILKDADATKKHVDKAINLFLTTKEEWIKVKGEEYGFGIKDNADFTGFMIQVYSKHLQKIKSHVAELPKFRGTVLLVKQNINRNLYGFISAPNGDNIYFDSTSWNDDIPADCVGKDVLYDLQILENGRKRANKILMIK